MNGRHQYQRGFTLGELLTAVAVMSIGVSLMAPGLDSLTRANRETEAINRLVSTLHLARSEAITRNVPVAACPSNDGELCGGTDWNAGWIWFADPDRDHDRNSDEPLLGAAPAVAAPLIRSSDYPRHFAYQPRGHLLGADPETHVGRFVLCDSGGAHRALNINAAGHPQLVAAPAAMATALCPDPA